MSKQTKTSPAPVVVAASRFLTYASIEKRCPTVLPEEARAPLMDVARDYVMTLAGMPLPDWDRENLSEGYVRSLAFAADFRMENIGKTESELQEIVKGIEHRDGDRAPIAGLENRAQILGHRLLEKQATAQAVFLMFAGAHSAHIEAFGKDPNLNPKQAPTAQGPQIAASWAKWSEAG
jgi:hypothetical protein